MPVAIPLRSSPAEMPSAQLSTKFFNRREVNRVQVQLRLVRLPTTISNSVRLPLLGTHSDSEGCTAQRLIKPWQLENVLINLITISTAKMTAHCSANPVVSNIVIIMIMHCTQFNKL